MSYNKETIGRNLDLVSKIQLTKLADEVLSSENEQAKKLLEYIEKLNLKIDLQKCVIADEEEDEEDFIFGSGQPYGYYRE